MKNRIKLYLKLKSLFYIIILVILILKKWLKLYYKYLKLIINICLKNKYIQNRKLFIFVYFII